MDRELYERIRNKALRERASSPDEAAGSIEDGMTIGACGGIQSCYPATVFYFLAMRSAGGNGPRVDLWAGGPLGEEIDGLLASKGLLRRRLGQQFNPSLRKTLNQRRALYSDQRCGIFPQRVRSGVLGALDVAVIEAAAITEEGHIIPSPALFDGASLVKAARRVIVEINTSYPPALEGIHDIYLPGETPGRAPIPLTDPADRIGTPHIPVEGDKISHIVKAEVCPRPSKAAAPDQESLAIGRNLVDFLRAEADSGRLPPALLPLELGIGSLSEAVLSELSRSPFSGIAIYTGGIGEGVLDLMESGKVRAVSTSGLYLSTEGLERFLRGLDRYKPLMVIRPLDIADSPEIILRLGLIAVNSAVEVDIYGHVNSSHALGTRIISGIGGSAEFAQNASISVFMTPSAGRDGAISAIVPMVSHADHSEHAVDVVVTEQGVADLRGLEPVERAERIIECCSHPAYRPLLRSYLERAMEASGGHEPHILKEAFSFHERFMATGTMREPNHPAKQGKGDNPCRKEGTITGGSPNRASR